MRQKYEHSGKQTRQTSQGSARRDYKRPYDKKSHSTPASSADSVFTFMPQRNLRLTAWQSLFISLVIAGIYLPEIQAAQGHIDEPASAEPDDSFALTNSSGSIQRPVQTQAIRLNHAPFFFRQILPAGTLAVPYHRPVKTGRATLNFHGIPVADLPNESRSCLVNMLSSTHTCEVDGKKWSLLQIDSTKTHTLQEYYNRRFASECMGIRTPESRYFSLYSSPESRRWIHFASEQIPGYVSANDVISNSRGFFWSDMVSARQQLVEKMGEKGLVDILIAASFLGYLPGDAWGAAGRELVLTIAAYQSPGSLDALLQSKGLGNTTFAISLDNIRDMHTRYHEMRSKTPPQVHESVDMTEERYQTLLDIFIGICAQVHYQGIADGLDPQVPCFEVNQLWTRAFSARSEDILSSNERSTSCYVG